VIWPVKRNVIYYQHRRQRSGRGKEGVGWWYDQQQMIVAALP